MQIMGGWILIILSVLECIMNQAEYILECLEF